MAIAKVILNGVTQMDVTQKTVTAASMLSGITALKNDGTDVEGSIATNTSSDLTVSGATVTAPAGYYAADASKSVANGSAATPATSITANPSITVGSNGLITATVSGSKNITPTVTAGYVSTGTAGTVSVSGSNTKQLTTKAATTYNTSSSNQTISSGTYLTGTQTIRAVQTSNIDASNIKDGVNVKVGDSANTGRIANVTGTFTDSSTVSTGQTAASAGDILVGYSAWVDGAEVQGSLRAMTTSEISAAVNAGWAS